VAEDGNRAAACFNASAAIAKVRSLELSSETMIRSAHASERGRRRSSGQKLFPIIGRNADAHQWGTELAAGAGFGVPDEGAVRAIKPSASRSPRASATICGV